MPHPVAPHRLRDMLEIIGGNQKHAVGRPEDQRIGRIERDAVPNQRRGSILECTVRPLRICRDDALDFIGKHAKHPGFPTSRVHGPRYKMGNRCCPRREPYENLELPRHSAPRTPPQFPWPRPPPTLQPSGADTFKLASRVYLQVKQTKQRVILHVDGVPKAVGVERRGPVIDLTISQEDPLTLKFVRGEKIYHDIPRDDSTFEVWTLPLDTNIYVSKGVIRGLTNGKIKAIRKSDADTLDVELTGTFTFEKDRTHWKRFSGRGGFKVGVWPPGSPTKVVAGRQKHPNIRQQSLYTKGNQPPTSRGGSHPPPIIRENPEAPPLYW